MTAQLDLVQHAGVVVATLASGSRGNCTYVGDDRAGVLIDCGVSTRQILDRLDAIGLGDVRIDGVLLTHEHSDHVAAAAVLDRKLEARQGEPVAFYATAGTAEGMSAKVRPRTLTRVAAGARVPWRSGGFEAHAVPHDTLEPVGWAVELDGVRAGVITDLGHAPRLVEHLLGGLDVAVVEFNHDVEMLMDGPYPWALKQRIRGRHGHLSNDQAAALVHAGVRRRLRHLVLAHLSEENNTPAHAQAAADRALRGADASPDLVVHVARQDRAIDALRVPPGASATTSTRPAPARTSPAPPVDHPTLFDAS